MKKSSKKRRAGSMERYPQRQNFGPVESESRYPQSKLTGNRSKFSSSVERFGPNLNKQNFKPFQRRDSFYDESYDQRFKPFNPEFLQNEEKFRPYNGISTEANKEYEYNRPRRFKQNRTGYQRYPEY